jgi:hypothetical protein
MPRVLLRLVPVHFLPPIPYPGPVAAAGKGSHTCTEEGGEHAAREERATGDQDAADAAGHS